MPAPRLKKVVDEVHAISARRGNGKVRVETWVDKAGNVVRYNLAYINHSIFAGDNGRVLGYDSQHGRHHRHYLGTVTGSRLRASRKSKLCSRVSCINC